ncbi:unnamed protein product [Dracunculus medinensis]|uniref:DCAF15_WD40 domain-containing protein n=1 Tax=Dracunculus medinensis TaxID=318479 RepID=A0A0N4UN79_DRAME|nr:unnamed protein product [Dracunculus medinensis]
MTEHFFEGIVFECDKERVISVYSPLTGLVEVKKTQFSARDIRPSFGRSCSFRLNFKNGSCCVTTLRILSTSRLKIIESPSLFFQSIGFVVNKVKPGCIWSDILGCIYVENDALLEDFELFDTIKFTAYCSSTKNILFKANAVERSSVSTFQSEVLKFKRSATVNSDNTIKISGLKVHLNHHLEKWCHLKQPIGEDYDFSRKNVSIIYYRQFKDQNIDAVALFITNRSELKEGIFSTERSMDSRIMSFDIFNAVGDEQSNFNYKILASEIEKDLIIEESSSKDQCKQYEQYDEATYSEHTSNIEDNDEWGLDADILDPQMLKYINERIPKGKKSFNSTNEMQNFKSNNESNIDDWSLTASRRILREDNAQQSFDKKDGETNNNHTDEQKVDRLCTNYTRMKIRNAKFSKCFVRKNKPFSNIFLDSPLYPGHKNIRNSITIVPALPNFNTVIMNDSGCDDNSKHSFFREVDSFFGILLTDSYIRAYICASRNGSYLLLAISDFLCRKRITNVEFYKCFPEKNLPETLSELEYFEIMCALICDRLMQIHGFSQILRFNLRLTPILRKMLLSQ